MKLEPSIADEGYSIKPINSSTGLYIEELANLRTFHTNWKLITFLNISLYEDEYNYIQKTVHEANEVCTTIIHSFNKSFAGTDIEEFSPKCDENIKEIFSLLSEIEEYNSKWFIKGDNVN